MKIKAKYDDGKFIPLDDVDLEKGEIVELNISEKDDFSWKGSLKDLNKSSVELQHEIKRDW